MDLIIRNAKIITIYDRKPFAEAAAVNKGKFIKVGTNEEIDILIEDDTKVVDLGGRTVVPGFNDGHMHLLSYGLSLHRVNLTGSTSIHDVKERIGCFMRDRNIGSREWIEGTGWNQDCFQEKVFPTKSDLDEISTEIPIFIIRACYHVAVVNSAALKLMGVYNSVPEVEGGKIDIDEQGRPNGVLRENAIGLVYSIIPEPSIEEYKKIICDAIANASSKGITSIQTDDFGHIPSGNYEKIIRAYRELNEENKLHARINEQCLLQDMHRFREFINKGYITGIGDEFFKIGPLKLLTDGSLGARTALLKEPYSDDPNTCGISIYNQEGLDELVVSAHNSNMQIAIHCIGDRAMEMAFNSFERAQKQNPRTDCRHSIVHCQITNTSLLDKFKALNVIAHIQPIFLDYDLHIVEERVGKERSETAYNWKSLIDRDVHVVCGSDCPVEGFDVMNNIYCAVTRMDLTGYPEGGWLPNQKLSVYESLKAFTQEGAYASFEERIKGSITEGKLADMAVLSENILDIEPEKIKDIYVFATYVGGKCVYERNC